MNHKVLKIKDGKFVNVRSFEEGLKLCAVDLQTAPTSVNILTHKEHQNRKAFNFKYKGKSYMPQVDGNFLKLEKANNDNCHWFDMESSGSGEYYRLLTVGESRKYISISQTTSILELSETDQDSAYVTVQDIDI